MTQITCESKLRLVMRSRTYGRSHAQETRWQSGVRSCILLRLTTQLVQELHASTVPINELNEGSGMVLEKAICTYYTYIGLFDFSDQMFY